jgi:hypothetical protein
MGCARHAGETACHCEACIHTFRVRVGRTLLPGNLTFSTTAGAPGLPQGCCRLAVGGRAGLGCPRRRCGGSGTSLGQLEQAGGRVCTRLNLAPRGGRANGGSESTAAVAVAVAVAVAANKAVVAVAKAPAARGAASGSKVVAQPVGRVTEVG